MTVAVSPAAFERSVVRSDLRLRTLLALSSLSEAFPRQLALAARVDTWRLHAAMHGRPPDYAVEYGLVSLGLAELRWTPHGRVYAITERGRRKSRQITSRWARRARRRVSDRSSEIPVSLPVVVGPG